MSWLSKKTINSFPICKLINLFFVGMINQQTFNSMQKIDYKLIMFNDADVVMWWIDL